MSRQLAATLQGLKSLQEAEAVLAGTPAPDRCFSTAQAKPINEDAFRNNVWSRLLRRAGLRHRKPHSLRHTFASLLIEAGEPLKYVQEQLGHHSPASRSPCTAISYLEATVGRWIGSTTRPSATPAQPTFQTFGKK